MNEPKLDLLDFVYIIQSNNSFRTYFIVQFGNDNLKWLCVYAQTDKNTLTLDAHKHACTSVNQTYETNETNERSRKKNGSSNHMGHKDVKNCF